MPVSPSGSGTASPTQAVRGWHQLTHTLAYRCPEELHRAKLARRGIRKLIHRTGR